MKDTGISFLKTGLSLGASFGGFKFMDLLLNSSKGFLAANSKFAFMNLLPIPNSAIIMLVLSAIGMLYVWHKDINK